MRKTLILLLTCISLPGAAFAEIELLYGYDFNTEVSDLTDSSTLTNLGSGLSSIGVSSTGDGNLATSPSIRFGNTGNGSYNGTSNRMIVIEDADGLGVSTSTGFSLTLNYKDNGDDWSNVASFTVGSSTYNIQTGSDTRTICIFAESGSTPLSASVELTDPTESGVNLWYSLVLSCNDQGVFTFSLYSTGDEVALLDSVSFTADTGDLTMFRQGGRTWRTTPALSELIISAFTMEF